MAMDLPTPFSFTNIFKLHAVVAFVFLLPVLNGGLKGFIETITEGESAAPRRFAASRVNRISRDSSGRCRRVPLGRSASSRRSARDASPRARRVPAAKRRGARPFASRHANAP